MTDCILPTNSPIYVIFFKTPVVFYVSEAGYLHNQSTMNPSASIPTPKYRNFLFKEQQDLKGLYVYKIHSMKNMSKNFVLYIRKKKLVDLRRILCTSNRTHNLNLKKIIRLHWSIKNITCK